MASVARMLGEDLDVLHRKLAPFNRTLTEAVDFYVLYLVKQKEKDASEKLVILVDRWLAEKKLQVEKGTLRQRTYQTLHFYGDKYKKQWGDRRVGTITHHEIKLWLESLKIRLSQNTVSPASSAVAASGGLPERQRLQDGRPR